MKLLFLPSVRPMREVQGRQTKLHPGLALGKLVQPSPGTISQFFEIPTMFCPNGLDHVNDEYIAM